MEDFDKKQHWENVYKTKSLEEVSWYQPIPETSLSFIKNANLPIEAKIIDIGGGDSFLVDHLLELGYQNISVLDISEAAIDRAKERLGAAAGQVKWIVSDILEFQPTEEYDFWHDRAAFHFITDDREIELYLLKARQALGPKGLMLIGTFSESGPTKCSGITIKQYSDDSMASKFDPYFNKIKCGFFDHPTPGGSTQQFVFCSFRRKDSGL